VIYEDEICFLGVPLTKTGKRVWKTYPDKAVDNQNKQKHQ